MTPSHDRRGATPEAWQLPRGYPELDQSEKRELAEANILGLLYHWHEATTTDIHSALCPPPDEDDEDVMIRKEYVRDRLHELRALNALQVDKTVRPNKWFSNGDRADPSLRATVDGWSRDYELETWTDGPLGTFVTVTEFKMRPDGSADPTGRLYIDVADLAQLATKLQEIAQLAAPDQDADSLVER